MLHLNLPENPTVADIVDALKKIDQTKRVFDDVYNPITAIILDSQGDVLISQLPRHVTKPAKTNPFNAPPSLLALAKRKPTPVPSSST